MVGKIKTVDFAEGVSVAQPSDINAFLKAEKNYIEEPDAETSIINWSTTVTGAIARDAADPLRGTNSFELTAGAGSDTIFYDFTLDEADENQLLKIEFDQKTKGAYAAADFAVTIVKDPSGSPTTITPSITDIPKGQGHFVATWLASTTDTYRLTFTSASPVASADALQIDTVIVGPGKVQPSAPIGKWDSFTPSMNHSTNVTWVGYKRRIGENLEMFIQGEYTGATDSATLELTIPDSLTLDETKLGDPGALNAALGTGTIFDAGNGKRHVMPVNNTSTALRFLHENDTGGLLTLTDASPIVIASGTSISLNIRIPILEYDSDQIFLESNHVEYASHDGSSVVRGSAGALMPTSTPAGVIETLDISSAFTNIAADDRFEMEIQKGGGSEPWLLVSTEEVKSLDENASDFYGADADSDGSGGIVMKRGKFADTGGATWTATLTGGTQWRVRRTRAGAPVGFGLATVTNPGLVKQNRWERHDISGNVTTNITITELTFNNLIAGRIYRFVLHSDLRVNNGVADTNVFINVVHDSSTISSSDIVINTGTTVDKVVSSTTGIFQATTTSLTFVSNSASGNSFIGGGTYTTIEELNNYAAETTAFT